MNLWIRWAPKSPFDSTLLWLCHVIHSLTHTLNIHWTPWPGPVLPAVKEKLEVYARCQLNATYQWEIIMEIYIYTHMCMHAKSLHLCPALWKPHGLYPTRLLCPWDSPGKNSGVGCHALLQRTFLTQGLNLRLSPLHLLHWQEGSFTPSIMWEAHMCVYVCIDNKNTDINMNCIFVSFLNYTAKFSTEWIIFFPFLNNPTYWHLETTQATCDQWCEGTCKNSY